MFFKFWVNRLIYLYGYERGKKAAFKSMKRVLKQMKAERAAKNGGTKDNLQS